MELREFIGSLIIAILFLLAVRMFSIVIPALKETFEKIKELKSQIKEARREEQLKYEALMKEDYGTVKLYPFGNPELRHAGPISKKKRWEDDPITKGEPLTKPICEVCEKSLYEQIEFDNYLCNDCLKDDPKLLDEIRSGYCDKCEMELDPYGFCKKCIGDDDPFEDLDN